MKSTGGHQSTGPIFRALPPLSKWRADGSLQQQMANLVLQKKSQPSSSVGSIFHWQTNKEISAFSRLDFIMTTPTFGDFCRLLFPYGQTETAISNRIESNQIEFHSIVGISSEILSAVKNDLSKFNMIFRREIVPSSFFEVGVGGGGGFRVIH